MKEGKMPEPKLPTPLEFLQAIYVNNDLPLTTRMRAAIEAAQYVHPQLRAMAMVGAGDFAQRLDKAIARTMKVIDAKPVELKPKPPPTDVRLPPPAYDRRFRRV
jgi:hypothetical protein